MNALAPPVARPASAASEPAHGRPVIRLDAVTKIFQPRGKTAPVTAVANLSLDIAEGEIVGIIGRSGAGKSTLVRLINGLEKPTSGRVVVDGVVLSELAESEARTARRSIGMVFQHFNLLSSRTAAGNIALPLEIAGVAESEIKARVDELLGLVGLSAERDRYPSELSGGQKQRVGIARALAAKPKVLLCDEATSALDPETTGQILQLISRIRGEIGVTVVLITHEMAVVKAIADRVAVLDEGHLVEAGATFEIFAHPRHESTRTFVAATAKVDVPESLAREMQAAPIVGGHAIVRVLFSGPHATDPVLARLSKATGADVNIVAAQVEFIGGRPFGNIIVSVPWSREIIDTIQASLQGLGLSSEVLGHVA
jgi:D-methionine transport system ATP-binding protein